MTSSAILWLKIHLFMRYMNAKREFHPLRRAIRAAKRRCRFVIPFDGWGLRDDGFLRSFTRKTVRDEVLHTDFIPDKIRGAASGRF